MKCEFCNNDFKTISSLNYHKKTAKYCASIQNNKSESFLCNYCNKSLSTKQNLNAHIKNCKEYKLEENLKKIIIEKNVLNDKVLFLEQQLVMKDNQIKELQDKLENIAIKAAERPTIQNNNNSRINQIINNLQPLKVDDFKEHTHHLTIDHIRNGASGYAKYALEYPLKDKIICVDYARRKVKYKDENGKLVNDPEMTKISQKFFNAIEDSNNELIKEYNKVVLEQLLRISEGNEEISEVEAEKCVEKSNNLLDEMLRVKSMRSDIENIKKGNKPELLHDFVKDVCSKTTC
jgi:hypothetical protein